MSGSTLKDNKTSGPWYSVFKSSIFDLVGKCQFCALNKSTDNSHMDYVTSTALHS